MTEERFPKTDRISISNIAVNASYKINVLEKRALLAMAANIDTQPIDDINLDEVNLEQYLNENGELKRRFCTNRVEVVKFAEALGIKADNRGDMISEIDRICYGLMQRVVNLQPMTSEDYSNPRKRFEYIHWVEKCSLTTDRMYVEYRLSEDMIPIFIALKNNFTKLYFSAECKFKRDSTMRFYEIFSSEWGKSYCTAKSVLKVTLTLLDIRRYFDLDGVNPVTRKKESLYRNDDGTTNFKALNQWLIKPAIKELQDKSEFIIDMKNVREGRKVTAVEFTIRKADKTPKLPVGDLELQSKLVKYEVSPKLLNVLIKRYKDQRDYLLFGCEYCYKQNHRTSRKAAIEDYDSYLTAALASDWLKSKWASKLADDEHKKKQAEMKKAVKEGRAIANDDGTTRYLTDEEIKARVADEQAKEDNKSKLKDYFFLLPESEQKAIVESIKQKHGVMSKLLANKGYEEIWDSSSLVTLIVSATEEHYNKK